MDPTVALEARYHHVKAIRAKIDPGNDSFRSGGFSIF
jgi:hypothetical protein